MNIYLVLLNEPNSETWATLQAEWPEPKHYILTERIAWIAADNPRITTDAICEALGIDSVGKVRGVVVGIGNSIQGYNAKQLWEWMEQHES